MKNTFKKLTVALLVLCMMISVIASPILVIDTSAATTGTGYNSADDVVYKYNGSYIYNWGAREEDCVFLSSYAQAFYTGSYVYDTLSNVSGGSSQSNAPQSSLYSSLKSLMTSKHRNQTSYSDTKSLYQYTDCEKNGNKISSFYSGTAIGPNWGSSPAWNREHTWPNSKGLGGNDENDIMMLRPTATSENSDRGNTAYGKGAAYYNPNSESGEKHDLRGDCARICLYVYVRWGNTSYMWGTGGVMESLSVLLEWMEADPVDTWEMGRNDAVQSITGTRNVFVDYPEYAWLLFGKTAPTNMVTPSGEASDGNAVPNPDNNGGNNGGNSGGSTTPTPDTPAEWVPTTELKNGDKVLIGAAAYGKLLSTVKVATYYNKGVDYSATDFSNVTNDEIFVVTVNGDGSYTFTSLSGKVIAMADSYSSLAEDGANKSWALTKRGDGTFLVKNTGRNTYLEWYASKDNWSTYSAGDSDLYYLTFYTKNETPDTPTPDTPTPDTPTPDTPNTPDTPVTPGEPDAPTGSSKVTVTIADVATANGWSNSTLYSEFKLDDYLTVKSTGTPYKAEYDVNTGKYYSSDNTWRIYQNESPSIVINATGGKTIQSVKITYSSQNSGTLTLGNTNVASDEVVSVNASTITFGVGNTGTATNGQARITAIEVTYASATAEPDAPETDAPETDAPETDAPETDAPETDAPETDAPETDAPETDAPETDSPETDVPETDAPETDAPESDAPETDAPETDAPETDTPETDAPETDAPETDAPETNAPETNAPETDAPETDAPETDTSETDAPETDAPETDAPETDTPETDTPETDAPETNAPEATETETNATDVTETETKDKETTDVETSDTESESDAPVQITGCGSVAGFGAIAIVAIAAIGLISFKKKEN